MAKSFWLLGACLTATVDLAAQSAPLCLDPFGNSVPALPDPSIPDIAFATFRPGVGPVILYQPVVVTAPGPLRLFMYYHECAHHTLGHVLRQTQGLPTLPTSEVDADCASLVTLAGGGSLSLSGFAIIRQAFVGNPARPPLYPAGPVRVQLMDNCLQSRGIALPPP